MLLYRKFLWVIGICSALLLSYEYGYAKEQDAKKIVDHVLVTVTGVGSKEDEALLKNVKAYLSIEQRKNHSSLNKKRIRRLHKQATEEIHNALKVFGYYRPSIEAQLTPPSPPSKEWRAHYRITKNDPVRIKKISIRFLGDALRDPAFAELLDELPIKKGKIFHHTDYETAKRKLLNLAEERGYFDVSLPKQYVEFDEKAYTMAIFLHLDSQKRYHFGEVVFNDVKFSKKLLHQFISFKTGEPYSVKKMLRFRDAMNESGYFEKVRIKNRYEEQKSKKFVNLHVQLTPRKRNTYKGKIGYGTDTGLRLTAEVKTHYINRRGHKLRSALALTQKQRGRFLELAYEVPLKSHPREYFEVFINYNSKNETALDGSTRFEDTSLGIRKHHTRHLFNNIHVKETCGLTYLEERYALIDLLLGDIDPIDRTEILDDINEFERRVLDPTFRVLIPSIQWVYSDIDNPLYPTNAKKLGLTLQGGFDTLASNLSFWQIHLKGNFIRKIHKNGRLLFRADIAYTDATTQTSTDSDLGFTSSILPRILQFRTGGDRSVRGYAYEELDGGSNSLVSGKHLIAASIEYDYRILKDWGAAIFYDIGNAFNDYNKIDLHKGVGIGARWYSPIGAVRLDIARSLNKKDKPWRFHLTIGTDF